MNNTPRTDAASFSLDDGTEVTKAHVTREIEAELAVVSARLERAMKVVNAAIAFRVADGPSDVRELEAMFDALEEWGHRR